MDSVHSLRSLYVCHLNVFLCHKATLAKFPQTLSLDCPYRLLCELMLADSKNHSYSRKTCAPLILKTKQRL